MLLKKKSLSFLTIMLVLDAFALGGFVTLLVVNQLLNNQLNIYAPHNMTAASAILDFMDDLLLYFVIYAGTLLILILTTLGTWIWRLTGAQGVTTNFTHSTPGPNTTDRAQPRIIINADQQLLRR